MVSFRRYGSQSKMVDRIHHNYSPDYLHCFEYLRLEAQTKGTSQNYMVCRSIIVFGISSIVINLSIFLLTNNLFYIFIHIYLHTYLCLCSTGLYRVSDGTCFNECTEAFTCLDMASNSCISSNCTNPSTTSTSGKARHNYYNYNWYIYLSTHPPTYSLLSNIYIIISIYTYIYLSLIEW